MGCSHSKQDGLVADEKTQLVRPSSSRKPWSKSDPPLPQIVISKTPDPRSRISPTMTAYDVRVFGSGYQKPASKPASIPRDEAVAFTTIAGTLSVPVAPSQNNKKHITWASTLSPHVAAAGQANQGYPHSSPTNNGGNAGFGVVNSSADGPK